LGKAGKGIRQVVSSDQERLIDSFLKEPVENGDAC